MLVRVINEPPLSFQSTTAFFLRAHEFFPTFWTPSRSMVSIFEISNRKATSRGRVHSNCFYSDYFTGEHWNTLTSGSHIWFITFFSIFFFLKLYLWTFVKRIHLAGHDLDREPSRTSAGDPDTAGATAKQYAPESEELTFFDDRNSPRFRVYTAMGN